MFFLLIYRLTVDGVFDDFPRFRTTFGRFSKIVPKARQTFPNISRRLPKTFDHTQTNLSTNVLRDKLDTSKIINIFTREDMENIPLESRMYFHGVFFSKPLLSL